MSHSALPDTNTALKTAATYAKDLAERVIWTFLLAAGSVALAAGPVDMLNLSFWKTVGIAGITAVGSLVKGVLAKFIGDRNSASTASGV